MLKPLKYFPSVVEVKYNFDQSIHIKITPRYKMLSLKIKGKKVDKGIKKKSVYSFKHHPVRSS